MKLTPIRDVRRGATMVEAGIVLIVFLVLVFGMIDLGNGVNQYNRLSMAARHGARHALVHGDKAPSGWDGGTWGPTTFDVVASDTGIPIVEKVRPMLVGFDLDQTRIKVEWLDGASEIKKRVRVTVTSSYSPFITFIFGARTINLSASSTMLIAH